MKQRPGRLFQFLVDFEAELLQGFLARLGLVRGGEARLRGVAAIGQGVVVVLFAVVSVRVHLAVEPFAALAPHPAGLGDKLVDLVDGRQGRHTRGRHAALRGHAAGTVVVVLVGVNVGDGEMAPPGTCLAVALERADVIPFLGQLERLRLLT